MKILADGNMPGVERTFATMGNVELVDGRALTAESVADADVLLVRSVTKVDAALLEGSRVAFVGSATSGFDHIDRAFLQASGIGFAHAPGSNARSVVEYVLAAIAQTGAHLERLLNGGMLGIVGYGYVGEALAALASALGLRFCIYDPWLTNVQNSASLNDVLRSDVVTLHCELTLKKPWPSRHLINGATLEILRPDTLLINASRGGVIDNTALLGWLNSSPDTDVVLDVWEGEPTINPELLAAVTLGTAHIAGYSLDGKLAATRHLFTEAVKQLRLEHTMQQAPAKTAPPVQLAPDSDATTALRALIAARYVIAEDDARLRAAIKGQDSAADAIAFDQLRKTYPVRREVWGSTVQYTGADEGVTAVLQALGCTLHAGLKQ